MNINEQMTQKIDSTALPDWARWVAQDRDGSWWAYEHEPHAADHGWYENEVGRIIKLSDDCVNSEWKTTIFCVEERNST